MGKVILGGGLSGLSAAYYLLKKIPQQSITLIESSSRTGGWIKSNLQDNGTIFEQGPRTIRPRVEAGPNTLQLIEELNLTDQIVPIASNHPAARNRIIYAKGSLHLLPSSFFGFFKKQELFSKPIGSYMLNDLTAKKKEVEDEPIYDFVERRFGKEMADYFVSPIICGICAGNAKEISVKFFMRTMFQYEQQYGSVIKGTLQNVFVKGKKTPTLTDLALRAKKEKWSMYSFINGCETLPLALRDHILNNGVNIRLNTSCKALTVDKKKVTLHLDNGDTVSTDHLISAIPASILGTLLQQQHPEFAESLKNLTKNVSLAVVNLQFKENLLKNEGFGVLVPPKEKLPILGIIFDSCCFPKTNCGTTLTVMMGGYWFEHHFGSSPTEETVLNVAFGGVKHILNISESPEIYKVNILHQCMPQYVVGHDQHLNNLITYIKTHQLPISVCGASYYGVGINDVILSAKKAVEESN